MCSMIVKYCRKFFIHPTNINHMIYIYIYIYIYIHIFFFFFCNFRSIRVVLRALNFRSKLSRARDVRRESCVYVYVYV